MINVTEFMRDEDWIVSIEQLRFENVDKLTELEHFDCIEHDGLIIESVDEHFYGECGDLKEGQCSLYEEAQSVEGEQGPLVYEKEVKRFKKMIEGKRGVLVTWSVEYDSCLWFIETDNEADLLTSDSALLRNVCWAINREKLRA